MPQLSLHTPVGDITITQEDDAIIAVDWGWGRDQDPTELLLKAKQQLEAYFDGDEVQFNLPLNPYGTQFQRSVWDQINAIPYGETKTYGDLATAIGSVARPIGGACGRNPIPIIIPCHRVLASGGKLGGYTADGGTDIKIALLRLEGVFETQSTLPF